MYDYEEKDLSYITNNLYRADVENLITDFQTENPGKIFTNYEAAKIINDYPEYSQEVKDALVLRSYKVKSQPVVTSADGIDLRNQLNSELEKYVESGKVDNRDTEKKIKLLMSATDNVNARAKLKLVHMTGELADYTQHADSLGLQNPLGVNRKFERDELVALIPEILFEQEDADTNLNIFKTETEDKFLLNEASINFQNLTIAFKAALEKKNIPQIQNGIDLKSGKFVVSEDTLQKANEKLKETDLSMDEVQQLRLINEKVATLSQDGENNWHKFTLIKQKPLPQLSIPKLADKYSMDEELVKTFIDRRPSEGMFAQQYPRSLLDKITDEMLINAGYGTSKAEGVLTREIEKRQFFDDFYADLSGE